MGTTVPSTWENCDLNELIVYVTSGSRDWSKYYSDFGANFIRTQDINTDTLDLSKVAKVSLPEKVEGKRTLVQQGDLLITITGANVGKCAHVSQSIEESYVSQSVALVRPVDKSLAKFLQLQLISPDGEKTKLQKKAYGMGRPVLNLANIRELNIALPPLAEQKQIATKLDELLAQVDTIKTRLDAIPTILKHFRQSVLAAAVSGKLTEEWRNINNLSIEDWPLTNIGNVAVVATGKTPKRTEKSYWEEGSIPWLTSSVTGNEYCYEADQFITDHAVNDCSLKLFEAGTLLLAMYGEGKTRGQVTELKISAACNQACAAIIVDEIKTNNSFIKLRLKENYEEIRKAASGGNQPNLNLNKVREIVVNLPSLIEQIEIVKQVDKFFNFIDQIEKQVNAAQTRVNNLTQSILAKAFRGELTADWREQNPDLVTGENSAEALLERIRTEQESLKPAKKTKRKMTA